jgi:hypothetical protein
MATDFQIKANRLNSRLSTGPVTESGKANSSRNHLTLGLYTRQDYVKPEERDLYKEFCQTMYLELDPAGLLQETLASEITGASWRLRRCSAAEGELADYAEQDPLLDESKDKSRRSIDRARASAHSILHRCLNQLRKLKSETKRQVQQTEKHEAAKEIAKADKVEEVDEVSRAFEAALDSIMSCPEPDWSFLDAELGLNCSTEPDAAESEADLASICTQKATPALIAALQKRNSPCACKSGKVYRECCGINEPRDWRKAA